MSNVHTLD